MSVATLPVASVLSDDEIALINHLESRLIAQTSSMWLLEAYYLGMQAIQDLGISLPPQLRGLRTVVGWPRLAVDALEERLDVEGFRMPDAASADTRLNDFWQANDLDEESPLAHSDALKLGRSYITIGSGACGPGGNCPPLITIESPLHMVDSWDARTRMIRHALRVFTEEHEKFATLYTPEQTVHLASVNGMWVMTEPRDIHNLGIVPVVRMPNRQSTHDRRGHSEITPEVMSLTDAACRTLVGSEVAREFFSAPQRYILDASEEDFEDSDGNPVSAWQTYIGRVLALSSDEEGKTPSVGQFAASSPSGFIDLLKMYAEQFAALIGVPPHYMGFSTANPASADAIRSAEGHLVKRAERRQRVFGGAWEQAMRIALLIADGKNYDPSARRMETLWRNAATPTQAATADATVKLVQSGILPADSSVTLDRLGFSAGEQQRIALDRQRSSATEALKAITSRFNQAGSTG